MSMNEQEQIAKCQRVPVYHGHTNSYIASCEYHDRRHKAGDRQLFCKKCQRWKYSRSRTVDGFGCDGNTLCEIAELEGEAS